MTTKGIPLVIPLSKFKLRNMFYCEKCRITKLLPESLMISVDKCEFCGETSECFDVPSGYLPKEIEVNITIPKDSPEIPPTGEPPFLDALMVMVSLIEQQPQVQYSLNEQLRKGIKILNKFGLYDAADFIRDSFNK
jgi:hypothetical protein